MFSSNITWGPVNPLRFQVVIFPSFSCFDPPNMSVLLFYMHTFHNSLERLLDNTQITSWNM